MQELTGMLSNLVNDGESACEALEALAERVKEIEDGDTRREFFLHAKAIGEEAECSADEFGWDGI